MNPLICKICGSSNTVPTGIGNEWVCLDCGHKGKPLTPSPANRKF